MNEPMREQVEPKQTPADLARKTAEGRDQATPFLAISGVALTIAIVVAVFVAVLLTLWWVLAR